MNCGTAQTSVPEVNLNAIKGDTYEKSFLWRDKETQDPIDLTGYTALMQVKKQPEDDTYFVELTELAGITLGGVDGTILIEMLPTQTNAIDVGNNSYDLQLTDTGGKVTTLFGGIFALSQDNSR